MAEDKKKFLLEEMIFKGGQPYYPIEKVAKLLNVKDDDIDLLCSENTEIVANSISIEDHKNNETTMYLDNVGVLQFLFACEDNLGFGKDITTELLSATNEYQKGCPKAAKQVINNAHPFVKAYFQWATRVFDLNWGKMPVQ